jgi:hypothetical protein
MNLEAEDVRGLLLLNYHHGLEILVRFFCVVGATDGER